MQHPMHGGLTFEPSLESFAKERAGMPTTVLSGGNNSGKSLLLKWLKQTMGKTAYMVGSNRFYHVYHFSTSVKDPNALENFETQFQTQFWNEQFNYEQNYIDLNQIIVNLSDVDRNRLFELCGRLIGAQMALRRLDNDNELSVRYIDVDGKNLSVASTGTRLLLTILGICMDDRFKAVLIDEPELGLSPRVQTALARFLHDPEQRSKMFPHLKQVILATHSHLFLHRANLESNYAVNKHESSIKLSRVTTISEFHRLQFNLLGNALESLFLPAGILVVEGDTDYSYIERLVALKIPGRNIVVIRSAGDPKTKLHTLREMTGDLQRSPLRSRLFVVVDSVYAPGLKTELVGMGLLPENFVVWSRNGIEYLYPASTMQEIFSCDIAALDKLEISDDVVSLNGIKWRKKELSRRVLDRLQADSVIPEELEERLFAKLRSAID